MIDTLMRHREKARSSDVMQTLGVNSGAFALLTLHRPSNVDDRDTLAGILDALDQVQQSLPIVFPIHPRTRKNMEQFGLWDRVQAWENLVLTEPLGYLEFLCLMDHARVMLTDSGGIQEETTVLGTPCLTLRENTERPITVKEGTNCLVGADSGEIIGAFRDVMGQDTVAQPQLPKLWDGHAAQRIVGVLTRLG